MGKKLFNQGRGRGKPEHDHQQYTAWNRRKSRALRQFRSPGNQTPLPPQLKNRHPHRSEFSSDGSVRPRLRHESQHLLHGPPLWQELRVAEDQWQAARLLMAGREGRVPPLNPKMDQSVSKHNLGFKRSFLSHRYPCLLVLRRETSLYLNSKINSINPKIDSLASGSNMWIIVMAPLLDAAHVLFLKGVFPLQVDS